MQAMASNDGSSRAIEAILERILREQAAMRAEMNIGFRDVRAELQDVERRLREEIQRLRFVTGAAIRDHGARIGVLERQSAAVRRQLALIVRLLRSSRNRH